MPSAGIGSKVIELGGGAAADSAQVYWFDANDTATAATPITHVGTATDTYLTNDALGTDTAAYNPNSKAVLWNTATNSFDFTSLKIGDIVNLRIDLEISNAAAQEVDLKMLLGEGSATEFEKSIVHAYYKTANTGTPVTGIYQFYIGNNNTKNNPGRIRFASLDAATIKVIGWFYVIIEV